MRIIRHLNLSKNLKQDERVIAIGNFDGMHLGHKSIINLVKEIAKLKNVKSSIITFEPHPNCFFNRNLQTNFRIETISQKIKSFQNLQIDDLVILPFDHKMANMSAQNFIKEILIKNLNVKHVIAGYDMAFGKDRMGNVNMLKEFGLDVYFAKNIQDDEGKNFSSTIIRKLIEEGKISKVNQILGRNFLIEGVVVNGKKIARNIGFPTANLFLKKFAIKPKFGVYKTKTFIHDLKQEFLSITNFGIKPTVDLKGSPKPIFENHILNFSKDIYGKKISIEFLDFIREEKKFESISHLKDAINTDISMITK